nr:hypothetical transcript [Hymenolepis microstoma]
MLEARVIRFDESVLNTLWDVSSSEEGQESLIKSFIAAAQSDKQREDVQLAINVNENSDATSDPNEENCFQTSVSPEEVGRRQAEVCASDVVVDAHVGAGGSTIQLAPKCKSGSYWNGQRFGAFDPILGFVVLRLVWIVLGVDVNSALRALQSESAPAIDTTSMSPH